MGSPLTVLGEERGGGRKGDGEKGGGGRGGEGRGGGGVGGGERWEGKREGEEGRGGGRVSNITLAHACYMKCIQLIWTTNNVILWLESQLKI